MLGLSRPRPDTARLTHGRKFPRLFYVAASKLRNSSIAQATNSARSVVKGKATSTKPRPTSTKPRPTSSSDNKPRRLPPFAPAPPTTLATSSLLFLVGAVLGPPLDGIHGAFGLLRYDVFPVSLGDGAGALRTSLLVPPLLGAFYAVSGALRLAGDRLLSSSDIGDEGEEKERKRETRAPLSPPPPSFSLALCALAVVVAHLCLSAILYNDNGDHSFSASQISLALYPSAFFVWLSFDRTATGLALAALTAAAAPLAELLLMNAAGVWHYPRADLFLPLPFLPGGGGGGGEGFPARGIVSWVPACYFAYSCWISALARALARVGMRDTR